MCAHTHMCVLVSGVVGEKDGIHIKLHGVILGISHKPPKFLSYY